MKVRCGLAAALDHGGRFGGRGEEPGLQADTALIGLGIDQAQSRIDGLQRVLVLREGLETICLPAATLGHLPGVSTFESGQISLLMLVDGIVVAPLPLIRRSYEAVEGRV